MRTLLLVLAAAGPAAPPQKGDPYGDLGGLKLLKPQDKVDVKGTGKRMTVAGYDASGYQVFSNGDFDSEVYIAPGITAAREIDPRKLERMVSETVEAYARAIARMAA